MIVFESIYPIQLNTELNWNLKLEESSNKAFQLKGIIITYIEQIEMALNLICSKLIDNNLETNSIFPNHLLLEKAYYSKSISSKINKFNEYAKTFNEYYPEKINLTDIETLTQNLNEVNRLRVIFTHSTLTILSEDIIILTNFTQGKKSKAFSKTTITINKDFIMADSTDESDLIFHIIGEGEGKYNKIEVLLSDLKKFHDQICGLFNFISDNNPNYIIAI